MRKDPLLRKNNKTRTVVVRGTVPTRCTYVPRLHHASSPPARLVGQCVASSPITYHQPSTRHPRKPADDCRAWHAYVALKLVCSHRLAFSITNPNSTHQQHITSMRGAAMFFQQDDG